MKIAFKGEDGRSYYGFLHAFGLQAVNLVAGTTWMYVLNWYTFGTVYYTKRTGHNTF